MYRIASETIWNFSRVGWEEVMGEFLVSTVTFGVTAVHSEHCSSISISLLAIDISWQQDRRLIPFCLFVCLAKGLWCLGSALVGQVPRVYRMNGCHLMGVGGGIGQGKGNRPLRKRWRERYISPDTEYRNIRKRLQSFFAGRLFWFYRKSREIEAQRD